MELVRWLSKILAVQAWAPEFTAPEPMEKPKCHMPIILELASHSQADLWCPLARQLRWIWDPDLVKDLVEKIRWKPSNRTFNVDLWPPHAHAYNNVNTYTPHIHTQRSWRDGSAVMSAALAEGLSSQQPRSSQLPVYALASIFSFCGHLYTHVYKHRQIKI